MNQKKIVIVCAYGWKRRKSNISCAMATLSKVKVVVKVKSKCYRFPKLCPWVCGPHFQYHFHLKRTLLKRYRYDRPPGIGDSLSRSNPMNTFIIDLPIRKKLKIEPHKWSFHGWLYLLLY